MLTLDANPNSPTFNTYCTLEEADTFAQSRLYSEAFTNADPNKRSMALVQATELLDTLKWKGVKTNASQPKSFPRTNLYNLDGVVVDSDIPSWLKRATLEVAINIISKDPNHTSFNKLQIEGLSVSRDNSSNRNWYSSSVKQIVGQYVSNPYSVSTVRV